MEKIWLVNRYTCVEAMYDRESKIVKVFNKVYKVNTQYVQDGRKDFDLMWVLTEKGRFVFARSLMNFVY